MLKEIKLFINPCLFRWPKEIPDSSDRLFSHALAGYGIVFWILQGLLLEPILGLLATILEIPLILALTLIISILYGKRRMFWIMASLLMGATGMVGLFAVPVLVWLLIAESGERLLAFYLLLLFPLWELAILDYVFQQLLQRSASYCFWLACSHTALIYLVTFSLVL